MMKLKNEKGVTLVVLTITIIVLLIVTNIIIYNSKSQLNIKNVNNLYSDIESIDTKVSDYYLKNNGLPIFETNAYISNSTELELLLKSNGGTGDLINPNDNGAYYVIDLSKIENLTLNYGRDYKNWNDDSTFSSYQDLYIINSVTHQIYYPHGIKLNDIVYFSRDLDIQTIDKIVTTSISDDGLELTINNTNKNTIENETKVIIDINITLEMNFDFQKDTLKYALETTNEDDTSDILFSKFTLENSNSAILMSKLLDDVKDYYLYIKVLDINGEEHIIKQKIPLIDNSQSLVLGLVDDLGTSAKIYLYGNPEKITTGTITVTMPEGITVDSTSTNNININAVADNTEITGDASTASTAGNYTVCTVKKNGTYTFSATDGTNTTETKIRVENIETFKAVESLGLEWATLKDGTKSTKAYNYKGASVPVGYYVDTKTDINTGLVVTDEIDEEGYSTGNEWVWVPVNSTVGNHELYIAETGTFAGATSVTYDKYSKLYDFTTTNGITTKTAISVKKPSDTSGYREPSLLSNSTHDETKYYSSINKRGTTTPFNKKEGVTAVATQYKTDYNNMITSVENYGGFYIGRYEITANGEKTGDALVNKNWYYLYNECMKLGKEDTNSNVITESGMIYGTLWDATMQWLAKSDIPVGYTGETTSGYGNYNTEAVKVKNSKTTIIVKPSGTSKKLKTGQTSYTRSNNIYDLSGNCYDWTQEAYSTNYRVLRGGYCYSTLSLYTYSANRLRNFPTITYDNYSSRPHFYIK